MERFFYEKRFDAKYLAQLPEKDFLSLLELVQYRVGHARENIKECRKLLTKIKHEIDQKST